MFHVNATLCIGEKTAMGNNIFVFEEGRIVQKGSHDSLMKEEGLYSRMWNAQAQYYS